ncbi:GlxA family transcriptional regulator [Chitinophaga nivalis]|uniref:GlxA family transcriptional regulator n=1 Tax=Chitinophaga nivalis TaxID=2991709 RepID=A0ABT3IIS5_9BACT|nr:GlxA family transcriptional regulator [Chitinophaga nivalis]MCW3466453.1 GlxA family transcriptional regulator [Chitinophaga nivalis]MCW3483856.1 GlxA family transcriptional regulator [Chitinophaga nivalis]
MRKRLVVIVAMPDGLSLDVTGPADVFSCTNRILAEKGEKSATDGYRIMIVSPVAERHIIMQSGLSITCEQSIDQLHEPIDTLVIGGFSAHHNWSAYPLLTQWLQQQLSHIRRVCSVCIGAFVLGESGLLAGRQATTHWNFCKELQDNYDNIQVDFTSIFVKDGNIYTSAGASTGIDLSLALVEEDYGRDISLFVAQTLVLYLRRPGNQAQFSSLLTQQLSSKKTLRELQQWIADNLQENLDVAVLAAKIAMSPRNFARVFLSETGLTPAKYVTRLRIESSKRYLEETSLSLDEIATACGFGSPETMRRIFLRHMDIGPFQYRSLFRKV